MKRFSFVLIILAFITSCSDKDKVPRDILPPDTMLAVMWDLMRAEAFLNDYVLNKDNTIPRKEKMAEWYQEIYRLHNITEEDFEKSFAYYKEHPLQMKDILDSINRKQIQISEPTVVDSVGKPGFTPPGNSDSTVNTDSIARIKDSLRNRRALELNRKERPQARDTIRKKRILEKVKLQ